MKERTYICCDLKSFYASVECIERGLNPLDTNLVVVNLSRTEKTICLAVTPSLKSYGISGRARLFEVIQRVKEVNAQRQRNTYPWPRSPALPLTTRRYGEILPWPSTISWFHPGWPTILTGAPASTVFTSSMWRRRTSTHTASMRCSSTPPATCRPTICRPVNCPEIILDILQTTGYHRCGGHWDESVSGQGRHGHWREACPRR